tara:strand:- start:72 stop:428 length:357 start_codon:yes stop_codon:yes gene_type:complete
MKNILIVVLLLLGTQAKAQKQFEGQWVTDTSSYVTTIIASDYAILQVFDFSFEYDNFIRESILYQDDYSFTTECYNPRNGYRVTVVYKSKNEDTITCEFSGDFNDVIELTRQTNSTKK